MQRSYNWFFISYVRLLGGLTSLFWRQHLDVFWILCYALLIIVHVKNPKSPWIFLKRPHNLFRALFRSVSSLVRINWEIISARARTGETVTWKQGLFVGVILGAKQILSCCNCVMGIVFWRKTENSKWVWKSRVLKCALGIAFPSISRWDTHNQF